MVGHSTVILKLIRDDEWSGTERHQMVEAFSQCTVTHRSEPSVDDQPIHDENRSRLAGYVIEVPDTVVEAPLDIAGEQPGSLLLSGSQITTASNSEEGHLVDIIACDFIDDGQLPSAYASPFGPEDHEHGLDFLTENELTRWFEGEREILRRGPVRRCLGLGG